MIKTTEKEIRETSPFTNNTKYLRVTLTEVKYLFDKNLKSLKKIPENGKISHVLSIQGRINIIKMTILPKAIY